MHQQTITVHHIPRRNQAREESRLRNAALCGPVHQIDHTGESQRAAGSEVVACVDCAVGEVGGTDIVCVATSLHERAQGGVAFAGYGMGGQLKRRESWEEKNERVRENEKG